MHQEMTAPTTQNGNGYSTIPKHNEPLSAYMSNVDVTAVQSGIATKYWLQLKAYPAGSTRSIWLLVNNSWKRFDNPNQVTSDCVQRSFMGSGSNVRVWFNGNAVVGLVVEGS